MIKHHEFQRERTKRQQVMGDSFPSRTNSIGGLGSHPGTAQDQVYPEAPQNQPRVFAGIVFHFAFGLSLRCPFLVTADASARPKGRNFS